METNKDYKAHYSINQDNKIYVDSNFINMCQGKLPNSELKHYGFGEFYLETPKGNVEFIRVDFRIKGFVGRTHRVGGNPDIGLDLLNAMEGEAVRVKVSDNDYADGTDDYKNKFEELLNLMRGIKRGVKLKYFYYDDLPDKKGVEFILDSVIEKNSTKELKKYLKKIEKYKTESDVEPYFIPKDTEKKYRIIPDQTNLKRYSAFLYKTIKENLVEELEYSSSNQPFNYKLK